MEDALAVVAVVAEGGVVEEVAVVVAISTLSIRRLPRLLLLLLSSSLMSAPPLPIVGRINGAITMVINAAILALVISLRLLMTTAWVAVTMAFHLLPLQPEMEGRSLAQSLI